MGGAGGGREGANPANVRHPPFRVGYQQVVFRFKVTNCPADPG